MERWTQYQTYMKAFAGLRCEILDSGCGPCGCEHHPRDQADKQKLFFIRCQKANQACKGTGYRKCQSNPFKTAFDMYCKECIYFQLPYTNFDSTYLLWLFRNFHCYPSITKYYWHYSKAWKRDFINIPLRFSDPETRNIACLHRQVIGDVLYHINFFRTRHWKFFIFNGWLQELAFFILNTSLHQLGLDPVNINEKAQLDVVPVLMLFTCLLDAFERLKKCKKFMMRHQNTMKMIGRKVYGYVKDIFAAYTRMKPLDPLLGRVEFIGLNYFCRQYETAAPILVQIQANKWSKQFANQECASSRCQNKRGSKGKNRREFFKCKRCKIAVYCSRGCAKYDWNKGNHKSYCERYQIVS